MSSCTECIGWSTLCAVADADPVFLADRTALRAVPIEQRPKPRMRGRLHQVAFFCSIPAGVVAGGVWPRYAREGRDPDLCAHADRPVRGERVLPPRQLVQGVPRADATARPFHDLRADRRHLHAVLHAGAAGNDRKGRARDRVGRCGGRASRPRCIAWTCTCCRGSCTSDWGGSRSATLPALLRGSRHRRNRADDRGGRDLLVGRLGAGTNKPNPWPQTFGYHEVWHAMTIAGAVCQYVCILLVVLGLPD